MTDEGLFERFPDDDACLDHLFRVRFGDHPTCPQCRMHGFRRLPRNPAYGCDSCGHRIHPAAGTFLENSRTPMQQWFHAMCLFDDSRHGLSVEELEGRLGVNHKTAWRMNLQMRKYMTEDDGDAILYRVILKSLRPCDPQGEGPERDGRAVPH